MTNGVLTFLPLGKNYWPTLSFTRKNSSLQQKTFIWTSLNWATPLFTLTLRLLLTPFFRNLPPNLGTYWVNKGFGFNFGNTLGLPRLTGARTFGLTGGRQKDWPFPKLNGVYTQDLNGTGWLTLALGWVPYTRPGVGTPKGERLVNTTGGLLFPPNESSRFKFKPKFAPTHWTLFYSTSLDSFTLPDLGLWLELTGGPLGRNFNALY